MKGTSTYVITVKAGSLSFENYKTVENYLSIIITVVHSQTVTRSKERDGRGIYNGCLLLFLRDKPN